MRVKLDDNTKVRVASLQKGITETRRKICKTEAELGVLQSTLRLLKERKVQAEEEVLAHLNSVGLNISGIGNLELLDTQQL